MRRLRAVLFDFDGTLAPSLPLWIRSYQIALAHHQITLSDAEVLRHCFFRDWSDIAADLDLGSAQEFQARVEASLQRLFREAELFPLARPLIEHCRAHGLQTALVTSSPRGLIDSVLARLGVVALFDFTICGNEVQNYKPHPEPVATTLKALKRTAHEAIMVGDSHADILAGKAAGTRTALFLPEGPQGFHDVDRLHAADPDHVFGDHGELPQLLGLPPLAR